MLNACRQLTALTNSVRKLTVTQPVEKHLIWKKLKYSKHGIYIPDTLLARHRKTGFDEKELHYRLKFIDEKNQIKTGERRMMRRREWKKRQLMNDQEFRTGIVTKVYTIKPKKPNSGNRKICKVRLLGGEPEEKTQYRLAYIPMENHNVTEHSRVLLYFHPKRDLIGIKLRVVRGVYDVNKKPGEGPKKNAPNHPSRRSEFCEKILSEWSPEPVPDIYRHKF